jgi:hypothetical protein
MAAWKIGLALLQVNFATRGERIIWMLGVVGAINLLLHHFCPPGNLACSNLEVGKST